jgi:hypothetical protein
VACACRTKRRAGVEVRSILPGEIDVGDYQPRPVVGYSHVIFVDDNRARVPLELRVRNRANVARTSSARYSGSHVKCARDGEHVGARPVKTPRAPLACLPYHHE